MSTNLRTAVAVCRHRAAAEDREVDTADDRGVARKPVAHGTRGPARLADRCDKFTPDRDVRLCAHSGDVNVVRLDGVERREQSDVRDLRHLRHGIDLHRECPTDEDVALTKRADTG